MPLESTEECAIFENGAETIQRRKPWGAPQLRLGRLRNDVAAAAATATIPILLGVAGLGFIAAGAVFAIVPLIVLGAGSTLFGFALFAIAEKALRDHSRRAAAGVRSAASRPRAMHGVRGPNAASEWASAVVQPRRKFKDEAVDAIMTSGAPSKLIQPSLTAAATYPPANARPGRATAGHVSHHEPFGMVEGPGFEAYPSDDHVIFEAYEADMAAVPAAPMMTPVVTANGHLLQTHQSVHAPEPPRDNRAWPGHSGPGKWGEFSGTEPKRVPGYDPHEAERRIRARRTEMAARLPVIGSMLDPSAAPQELKDPNAGKTRGKCSQCSSIIWAPDRRPLVLKCPTCGHKAKLY